MGRQKDAEERERENRTYREMQQCTFKPDTQRSQQSYREANQHNGIETHPPPRGFDPCVSRMRRATKEKERRRFEIDGNPYDAVEGRDYHAVMADFNNNNNKMKPFRFRTAERAVRSRGPCEGSGWAASPSFSQPRHRDSTLDDSHPLSRDSPRSGSEEVPAVLTSRKGSPRGRMLGPGKAELASEVIGGAYRSSATIGSPCSETGSEPKRQSSSSSPIKSPKYVQQDSPGSPRSVKSACGACASGNNLQEKKNNSTDDVLLYVDVSIAPGNMQRLTVLKGQPAAHAAAEFAAKHALSEHLAHKLHHLLCEQMRGQQIE